MDTDDVEGLSKFIERPGMYIPTTDRDNIVSFVHGYEHGTKGKCKFTDALSNLLAEKYSIKKHATGWSNQIERYSEEISESWVETFTQTASEVLSQNPFVV